MTERERRRVRSRKERDEWIVRMLGGRVEERRVIEREKRRKDGKSGGGRWKDRGGEGKKKMNICVEAGGGVMVWGGRDRRGGWG